MRGVREITEGTGLWITPVLFRQTPCELPVILVDERHGGPGDQGRLTGAYRLRRDSAPTQASGSNKYPRTAKESLSMRHSIIIAAVLFCTGSLAHAQVELKNYADANGYIDVQKLTCAQLAGTFQEDADFLGVWYSGWYNGLAKKHALNVPRTRAGIHNVIVYCKANPAKTVIQAIDLMLKEEKQ
jgi:HdeA/HdeB family